MNSRRFRHLFWSLFGTVSLGIGALAAGGSGACAEEPAANQAAANAADAWKSLTDRWVPCQFGGDGTVEIADDLITLGMGSPMTGVRWTGEFPRQNYELKLEARRTDGFDFFCGLTFPVGPDHVSFVLGGWGGGVVGISSIDGYDASENPTTTYKTFNAKQWYRVRVRVTAAAIECWIDEVQAVDQPRQGHKFDIRFEMDQSLPLGVASFQTAAELRHIAVRELSPTELEQISQARDPDKDQPRLRGGER